MHIPDAYLSPQTELAALGAMVPVWWLSARMAPRHRPLRQAPLLPLCAAFCFVVQMFNVPAPGGTTVHPLGAALAAILLGPWTAILCLSVTLVVQALFFGDGGVLALGANAWNMAVVAPIVGYAVYRLAAAGSGRLRRQVAAAALAGFTASVVSSISAGLILGAQPGLAHDAAGHALYFPFGFGVAVPAMLASHVFVAGPVEALVTAAALAFASVNFPTRLTGQAPAPKWVVWVLPAIAVLTPIGLLASGSAWGEWDVSDLARMAGYTPSALAASGTVVKGLLPDYALPVGEGPLLAAAGYVLSAVVGMASVAVAVLFVARGRREPRQVLLPVAASGPMPDWLRLPNPAIVPHVSKRAKWLSRTVQTVQTAMQRTRTRDASSSSHGLLQRVPMLPRTALGASVLLGAQLSHSWITIGCAVGLAFMAGYASRLNVSKVALRALTATLFFGLVLAAPLSTSIVTAGPVVFRVAGASLTRPGLESAGLMLLRLFATVLVTLTWMDATRPTEVVEALRRSGLPRSLADSVSMAYRYVFVMVETLSEMLFARRCREATPGPRADAAKYAGSGSAVLFAKGMALSQDVELAVLARTAGPMAVKPASDRSMRHAWTLAGLLVLGCVIVLGVVHAL